MPKAPKKIFSWVIPELAGREWCTVPPPPRGGTVYPGGGAGHGGVGVCALYLELFAS